MRLVVLIGLLGVVFSCSHSKESDDLVDFHCTPAKEFITSLTYLRQAKSFKLSEDEMRKISSRVAKGCHNSAKRFINTTDLLVTARLPAKASVKIALDISSGTDEQSDAFTKVFKSAFAKNKLDLNLPESVDIAQQIAAMIKKKSENAAEDFDQLVTYCVSRSQLNLPRTYCSQLAIKLSLSNEDRDQGIAESFIDNVEFLRNSGDGPKLSTKDALKLASDLVSISPSAPINFEEAYQFAVRKSGLGMSRSDAIKFSKKLVVHTRQLKKDTSGDGRAKLSQVHPVANP